MNCDFEQQGARFVCRVCGFKMPFREKPPLRNCHPQIRGLGDVIDRITTATGIKAVVHAVAGEDCGCQQRRDKLNKMFPFGQQGAESP